MAFSTKKCPVLYVCLCLCLNEVIDTRISLHSLGKTNPILCCWWLQANTIAFHNQQSNKKKICFNFRKWSNREQFHEFVLLSINPTLHSSQFAIDFKYFYFILFENYFVFNFLFWTLASKQKKILFQIETLNRSVNTWISIISHHSVMEVLESVIQSISFLVWKANKAIFMFFEKNRLKK